MGNINQRFNGFRAWRVEIKNYEFNANEVKNLKSISEYFIFIGFFEETTNKAAENFMQTEIRYMHLALMCPSTPSALCA